MKDFKFSLQDIDFSLYNGLSFRYCKNNKILPLKIIDGELQCIGVEEANSILAGRELALKRGTTWKVSFVEEEKLYEFINRVWEYLGSVENVLEEIEDTSSQEVLSLSQDLLEEDSDAPAIKFINTLFIHALREKASDIHLEPYEKETVIRMRMDGVLAPITSISKNFHDPLIARIKVMANLDIAEKRLPQDGRIKILLGGKEVDIRVSIIPTSFGERAVLRILDKQGGILALEELGLNSEEIAVIKNALNETNGIILVTGPTGAGKTTTLYAFINQIKDFTKNIITIEDPVEYQLEGLGQIQVNSQIGLTFAAGLRSVLRQDPDVILVGEIRDQETASIAIQASLTGHLVLSTLHTNDAPSGITRLLEMDIEPFLLASSLRFILAQRLVRKLCLKCRRKVPIGETEKRYFKTPPSYLFKPEGCSECKETGYRGREGIFELLKVDNSIRPLIMERADSEIIKQTAIENGMKDLLASGLEKVERGITTLEEVLKVAHSDGVV